MFKKFYPKAYYDSVYEIDFETYYKRGYRAVLFDIDNTLVPHDAPYDEKSAALFAELRKIGFKTCLVSNNHTPRVEPFAEGVGSEFICDAKKPSASGYERAAALLEIPKEQLIMVGDQLFTDMWGANNAGIYSVLTKKIARDPKFYIRLKRAGENIVMIFYRMYAGKHPAEKYLK